MLFMGAFLAHTTQALISLWQRHNLRMSGWEATQICLGLTALFILAAHIFGTRFPGAG
jgi:hypothetical protein